MLNSQAFYYLHRYIRFWIHEQNVMNMILFDLVFMNLCSEPGDSYISSYLCISYYDDSCGFWGNLLFFCSWQLFQKKTSYFLRVFGKLKFALPLYSIFLSSFSLSEPLLHRDHDVIVSKYCTGPFLSRDFRIRKGKQYFCAQFW